MMRYPRWAPSLAPWVLAILLLLGALVVRPAGSEPAEPETLQETLARFEDRIEFLESEVAIMELSAQRFERWMDCISMVPVSVFGDDDHGFGYAYDEQDGSAADLRPALAVDTGPEAQFQFLQFDHRDECQSDTTKPGTPGNPGTADPALVADDPGTTLGALELRLEAVRKRAAELNDMSEVFDEWESCLSSIGVTEYGDPDGQYGYQYEDEGGASGYAAALTVDVSEWDDPDYFFIGFIGDDRPFEGQFEDRECGHEPGEEVD